MKYKTDNVSITVKIYTYILVFYSEEKPGSDKEVLTTCVLWLDLTWYLWHEKRIQIIITSKMTHLSVNNI